jgi:hypothetical protein
MLDEESLQVAAAALEADWTNRATDKELDLLVASGRRPELFDKTDDGEIRIVLHPSFGDGPPACASAESVSRSRARARSLAELLPLSAHRAEEDELLIWTVIDPMRLPTILVGGQPDYVTLGALWDQRDAVGLHAESLRRSLSNYLKTPDRDPSVGAHCHG